MKSLPAILLAAFFALAVSAAGALEIEPFSAEALAQAKQTDAPVALHFHSNWCATCKLQVKAFESLRSDPGLDMKLLVVDFDEDRATSRAFRVPVSGAVIVLRGEAERARLIGVTDRERLREALLKAF
jgi:thiol-disulfide isomerase/thioredoxin